MSGQPYIISLVLLLTVGKFSTAQNLVPNPGFELTSHCNASFIKSSLENTEFWFNAVEPLTSVDWYSSCFCPSFCPPSLNYGYSYPHQDSSMIGFGPYSVITGLGESVGIKLSETLKKDSAYCFGFWIKNSKHHNVKYSLSEIHVAFINDSSMIHSKNDIHHYVVLANEDNDNSWHYMNGYYIAKGTEKFMYVGNFSDNPSCYFAPGTDPGLKYTYYFFDDFSMTPCDKDSLLSVVLDLPNVFTVDGNGVNDEYFLKQNNIKKLNVQVFNRWGNLIREYDGTKEVWNGTDHNGLPLTEGVYFVKAMGETTFGEVVQKTQFVHLIRP